MCLKSTVHVPVTTYHCQWAWRGCEELTARGALLPIRSAFQELHELDGAGGLVAKSCLTCDCMDCSLPGSSVHGISQARILEWGAISFSRASSWPRDWTWVSCIVDRFFFFYQLSYEGSSVSEFKCFKSTNWFKWLQMISAVFDGILVQLKQWYCGCFYFKHTIFVAVWTLFLNKKDNLR